MDMCLELSSCHEENPYYKSKLYKDMCTKKDGHRARDNEWYEVPRFERPAKQLRSLSILEHLAQAGYSL